MIQDRDAPLTDEKLLEMFKSGKRRRGLLIGLELPENYQTLPIEQKQKVLNEALAKHFRERSA